ncbi:Lysine exporter protein (LYSE/YGGA) [Arcobacter nitrofigilis DSM 7299]|uniref:Lysine exporter protein (LYSE/YGGA) n=1 Tax=Arcobacter nitrofigilis (strain ATCC 33309 / DSM 7299 / CCUG 15893 / LMG 7604 / NCTC 12251 / CI) TaxID=572480 RepID=D5UZK5_ARCNC|nr:LysE family translocator [Arcobacter nitrofigilis]ADG92242.1 Lysine exporter protein (LYSE/YGGA) [Arcobacter nitrofigilis DSM 7299]
MSLLNIFAFAGAMFLLAITPGPGVFATVSRALASGFSNAAFVVFGIILGDLIFLLSAIFGLSAIASIMGDFFILVKYLGGIYLLFLGYKILTSKEKQTDVKGVQELSWKKNFITGLLITLSNPKVILFYLGFLPTFVNLTTLSTLDIVIISLVTALVIACVLLFYAYSASGARSLFKSKSAKRKMNIAAGSVMITAGGALIIKA